MYLLFYCDNSIFVLLIFCKYYKYFICAVTFFLLFYLFILKKNNMSFLPKGDLFILSINVNPSL